MRYVPCQESPRAVSIGGELVPVVPLTGIYLTSPRLTQIPDGIRLDAVLPLRDGKGVSENDGRKTAKKIA